MDNKLTTRINQFNRDFFGNSWFNIFDALSEAETKRNDVFAQELTSRMLPYNWIQEIETIDGDKVEKNFIKIACAGYSKEEIKVSVKGNALIVKFVPADTASDEKKDIKINVLHQGLTRSEITMAWAIKNLKPESIKNCKVSNGILTIELTNNTPQEKAFDIEIN